MMEFFWEMPTRGKVAVLFGILFVAAMIIIVPYLLVRDFIYSRQAYGRFKAGDYEGAFGPLKKLLKSDFGIPDLLFDEDHDSQAEKAISHKRVNFRSIQIHSLALFDVALFQLKTQFEAVLGVPNQVQLLSSFFVFSSRRLDSN